MRIDKITLLKKDWFQTLWRNKTKEEDRTDPQWDFNWNIVCKSCG